MQLVCHWEEALEQTDNEVVTRIALLILIVRKHLTTRIEQEESVQPRHPLGALAAPAKIKMLRNTNAPKMPQKSTSCWYLRSIPKNEKSIRKTKRLSMDNDFSIR